MTLASLRMGARRSACILLGAGWVLSPVSSPGSDDSHPAMAPLALRQPVAVGAGTDAYPYSYLDSSGRLAGFAVEILDAVAHASAIKVERVQGTTAQIRERFQKSELQMLQSQGIPFEASLAAEFTSPILSFPGSVYVQKDGPIKNLRDLNGRPFGVMGGFAIADRFLSDHNIKAQIVRVATREMLLLKLSSGEIAGCFLSQLSELSVSQELHLSNIATLAGPFDDYQLRQAFAVHRGDAELLARLNEGLAIVHRSGQYDQIYKKHFSQFRSYILSAGEIELYVSVALALALATALLAYVRQRSIREALSQQKLKLEEQGLLLRALYDNVPMGMTVIETGPKGPRVLSMNRRAHELYSVGSEALNVPVDLLPVSDEVRQHLIEAVRRPPLRNVPGSYETLLGSGRRMVEVTPVALASPDAPDSSKVCVLANDITDRKKQESEIVRSRKLRAVGELVGGIAHEFNNLLTPVMLKAGEIQMSRPGDAELQQDIEIIVKAVQRTAELTRRLLAFGRKSEHRPETVRVSEIAAGCFDLLKNTVDRRICWTQAIPIDLPPLYFNATDLYQILVNLMLNAKDALTERLAGRYPPGWTPTIAVEAKQLPPETFAPPASSAGRVLVGWQLVTVTDNGLGMPAEVVERIFEPFFTTKEVGKGTGLGLATVWHLVNDAGGHVKVESTMGSGSTFRVYLPVWPSPEKRTARAAHARPDKSVRILLVEDEVLVAQPLVQALGHQGNLVRHFGNGLEAWQHLERDPTAYELLIIDVNLPGMNGIDIVARVRGSKFAGRILMVSGRFSSSDMGALARLGIDHSITKPFDLERFMDAVRDSLAARPP